MLRTYGKMTLTRLMSFQKIPSVEGDQKEIKDQSFPNVVIGNPENLKNLDAGLPIEALGSDNKGLFGQPHERGGE